MTNITFKYINKATNEKNWMLCFHHVGSSYLDYLFLRNLKNTSVWIAELPGRNLQVPSNPHIQTTSWLNEIIDFIHAMHKKTKQPGILFGLSLGAHMAFHSARVLEKNGFGYKLKKIFIASALSPAQFVVHDVAHFLSASDEWIAQEFCIIKKGENTNNLSNVKINSINRIRFDYRVYQLWQSLPFEEVNIPITGFFGKKDHIIDSTTVELWSQSTYLDFNFHWLEGGHFFTPKSRYDLTKIIFQEQG